MFKTIKITLASLLIIILGGCFAMSAKTYVKKTEPRFNEIFSAADSYGNSLNNDAISASQKIQSGTDLTTKAKAAKLEVETLKPPDQAKTLHADLLEYYGKIDEVIAKINNLYEFIDLTVQFSKSLEESTKDLPSDFSKDLSSTKSKFTAAKGEQQKKLDELKGKDVDAIFAKSKQALIDILDAYVDFLGEVVSAIDAKKSDLVKDKEFNDKLNKANDIFQSEMNSLQSKILSKEEEDRFNKLEEEIKNEFNRLR